MVKAITRPIGDGGVSTISSAAGRKASSSFWRRDRACEIGHVDGMEFNINSRQTDDIDSGAEGYRPTLNSYLFADAEAALAARSHKR